MHLFGTLSVQMRRRSNVSYAGLRGWKIQGKRTWSKNTSSVLLVQLTTRWHSSLQPRGRRARTKGAFVLDTRATSDCEHEVIEWSTVAKAKRQLILEAKRMSQPEVLVRECRRPNHAPKHEVNKIRFGYRPTAGLQVIQGCAVLHITWLGHLRLPKIENGQLSAD